MAHPGDGTLRAGGNPVPATAIRLRKKVTMSGTDPRMSWQVAPTGGIVILKLRSAAPASTWSLVRAIVSGGSTTQQVTLFSSPGSAVPVFVDIGDGTKAPLDPTLSYQYTFTTSAGTVTSDPIIPSAA